MEIKNTSYKVHVQRNTDAEIAAVNIEQGAMLVSDSGLYMGYNGENVRVYPQSASSQGLGWARYVDTEFNSSNKITLQDQVQIPLPNNSGTIYKSSESLEYYNSQTQKLSPDHLNDVYSVSIMFKASASNANQTHLDLEFQHGANPTLVENLSSVISFYKGNDEEQKQYLKYSFYVDSNVLNLGASIHINSHGGTAKIWDIQYFIEKTQSYA